MKAVFFDIDGTIWDNKMRIPDSTVSAIGKLREKGHLAFINSGRAKSNILDEKLLGIGFDGIVAACGNYIEIGEEVIYEKCLTDEQVRKVIKTADECGMPIVLEGPEYHYISPIGFELDPYVDYLFEKLGDRAKLTAEYDGTERINKFSADVFPDTDFARIKRELFDFVDPINHDGMVYEFVPTNSSKAIGIGIVCEKLGIAIEDTYAFGDSNNDIDMLRFVGHGVCMGGGMPSAQAVSEYITDTLSNDGLAKGLAHYGLI